MEFPEFTVRAVCFDLDGTMFNTEHLFFEAGGDVLRPYNRTMTREVMDVIIGRRPMESFRRLVDYLQITVDPEVLLEESRLRHDALIETKLEPMPGVVNVLRELARRGIPCAIATSSPREYAERLLRQAGLREYFQFLLTAEDVGVGKPNPEIYLKAAERFQVLPAEMVVFEDSAAGTKAAVTAGACAVAVPHEFTAGHDFSGAALTVASLQDGRIFPLLFPCGNA